MLIFIPTFLFYKEKPLTPPSISENEDIKVKRSFKNEVIALLRDSNFVWVSIATSSMISYTYVFPTILEEMTSIYGYNEYETSNFGIIFGLSGVLGCVGTVIYMNFNKNFRLVSLLTAALSLICKIKF